MSRRICYISLASAVAILSLVFGFWEFRDPVMPAESMAAHRLPQIHPDYTGTVIPPNICPLNFVIDEPGVSFRVCIRGTHGESIDVASRKASVVIPIRPWKKLLEQNRGCRIGVDVYVEEPDGRWVRFDTMENRVATEDIDSHLVYRLLGAVFTDWGRLGIYQRNLENYDELPILQNASFDRGCVNCHAFAGGNRPDRFSIHVRPSAKARFDGGMIAVANGRGFRIETRSETAPSFPTYTSWRPETPLAAFSLNNMGQFLHGAGAETREVFDVKSDIAVVDLKSGRVSGVDGLSDPTRLETFPTWSPSGDYLYFCSAPALWEDTSTPPFRDYDQVKYDLMRIPFDLETDTWGKPETVLTAEKAGLSISEPRVSPDGRFVLFCMSAYGSFPVLQASSDLCLMDLKKDGESRHRLLQNANSSQAESWHSWSSNSRWFVFSSKRGNGLFARPYVCYVDDEGTESKPFLLPQKDPSFYDTCLKTYNVPELVCGPVTVEEDVLTRPIFSEPVDAISRATRPVANASDTTSVRLQSATEPSPRKASPP
jgi:WD40 repeat protein